MKKRKLEKGITLVALVITIIVLLILAVVAIGAVRDSGIIGHAQNSADRYNAGKLEEESMLGEYEDVISQYETNGNGSGESFGEEIMWEYYEFIEEEYQAIYLAYIGDEKVLTIDEDEKKEVQAYKIIQDGTQLNDKGDEEIIFKRTNEVNTIKMNNCELIYTGGSVFIKGEAVTPLEELVISGNKITNNIRPVGGNIKNIKFDENIQRIPGSFCKAMTSLTSVELPSTLNSSGGGIFFECTNLRTIRFNGTKEQWNNIQWGDDSIDTSRIGNITTAFSKGVPSDAKVIFSDGTEEPLFLNAE